MGWRAWGSGLLWLGAMSAGVPPGLASAAEPEIVFIDVETDPGAPRYPNFRKALAARSETLAARSRYDPLPQGIAPEARRERLRKAAALRPLVLVTHNTDLARDARDLKLDVPLIFATLADPLDLGFVDEANRNLHNVTGISVRGEPMAKQLELLREWVGPRRPVGVLADRYWIHSGRGKRALALVEAQTGAPPVVRLADNAAELDAALADMRPGTADAWLVVAVPFALRGAARVVARLEALGRPAVYSSSNFTDAGGVLSYEAHVASIAERLAAMAVQIAGGARARDVPFERASEFRLSVNVAAAERSAFPVPKSLLRRANAFR